MIPSFSIVDLLSNAGFQPVNPVMRDKYLVYPTPLRPSRKTSFFVYANGQWEDRGIRNIDGDTFFHRGETIDFLLASGLANGRRDAIRLIISYQEGKRINIENSFFIPSRLREGKNAPIILLYQYSHIMDPGLLKFLEVEGIDVKVAENYLTQVVVEQGHTFRAVDNMLLFRTSNGSNLLFSEFEIRISGSASMTFISGHDSQECMIFTHIFDFLRLISSGGNVQGDVVVMNHISLLAEALEIGKRYKYSTFFLRENSHTNEIFNRVHNRLPNCQIKYIR